MRRTWLIRHGESGSNAGLTSLSPADSPLTERGRSQAQILAECLAEPPDLVISSPYWRAVETAAPVLKRFPGIKIEEWPVQEFTYLEPSRYAGTTVAQRRPHAQAYWERCDPLGHDGPGAESFAEFMGRVDTFLRRISEATASLSLVFTHEFFVKAVVWRLLNPGSSADPRFMASFQAFHCAYAVDNVQVTPVLLDGYGLPHLGPPWVASDWD